MQAARSPPARREPFRLGVQEDLRSMKLFERTTLSSSATLIPEIIETTILMRNILSVVPLNVPQSIEAGKTARFRFVTDVLTPLENAQSLGWIRCRGVISGMTRVAGTNSGSSASTPRWSRSTFRRNCSELEMRSDIGIFALWQASCHTKSAHGQAARSATSESARTAA